MSIPATLLEAPTAVASTQTAMHAPDWTPQDREVLLRYALHRLGNRHAAEDIVQDTLLAALECHCRFAGQSARRTWLVGILKHKIADHYRRTRRARELFAWDGAVPPSTDADAASGVDYEAFCPCYDSPDQQCERAELWSALHEALALLPARTAEAFRRGILENGDSCRVCHDLGISPTNYWVMLHRARKHLREFLSAQGFFEPACG